MCDSLRHYPWAFPFLPSIPVSVSCHAYCTRAWLAQTTVRSHTYLCVCPIGTCAYIRPTAPPRTCLHVLEVLEPHRDLGLETGVRILPACESWAGNSGTAHEHVRETRSGSRVRKRAQTSTPQDVNEGQCYSFHKPIFIAHHGTVRA